MMMRRAVNSPDKELRAAAEWTGKRALPVD
jgi:hypothetical protein